MLYWLFKEMILKAKVLLIYFIIYIEQLIAELDDIKELDKDKFVDYFVSYLDHTSQFNKLRYILYIELGLRPGFSSLEYEIINNTLDWTFDLNEYALKNMRKGDAFYVLNKKFYDSWLEFTHKRRITLDLIII